MVALKPFDVAKEMERVTRPDCVGQLNSRQPHAGRADIEGQLCLLAATAQRLCRPDETGRYSGRYLVRRDTIVFDFPGPPAQAELEAFFANEIQSSQDDRTIIEATFLGVSVAGFCRDKPALVSCRRFRRQDASDDDPGIARGNQTDELPAGDDA